MLARHAGKVRTVERVLVVTTRGRLGGVGTVDDDEDDEYLVECCEGIFFVRDDGEEERERGGCEFDDAEGS
jgi:hypothetical protein